MLAYRTHFRNRLDPRHLQKIWTDSDEFCSLHLWSRGSLFVEISFQWLTLPPSHTFIPLTWIWIRCRRKEDLPFKLLYWHELYPRFLIFPNFFAQSKQLDYSSSWGRSPSGQIQPVVLRVIHWHDLIYPSRIATVVQAQNLELFALQNQAKHSL